MSKDVRDRYQSATEMATDLRHALRSPSGGFVNVERSPRDTKLKRRNAVQMRNRMRTWLLVGVTAVMVTVLTLVGRADVQ